MTDLPNIYYRLIRIVLLLLARVPRELSIHLANGIGRIWFLIDKRHRDVALSNLTIAFKNEKSPDEINALAVKTFQNLARIPFEIAWSLKLDREEFKKKFEIKGLSHLKAAFEKGKGVLVLTGHTGSFEMLHNIIQVYGYPVNIVYRPLTFKPANRYLSEYRSRFGVKLIPKKRSMRKILKALADKEVVGIVLDQDSGFTAGLFAEFFGKKACTSKGFSLIALKTEAPVIPVFLTRVGLKFRVEIGEEIPLIKTGDKMQDMEINTTQYNKAIEEFVRKYPDQWFWVHNRWKTKQRIN